MMEQPGRQRWAGERELARALVFAAMLAGFLDACRLAAGPASFAMLAPGLSLAGVALLVMLSPTSAGRRARWLWMALTIATIAGLAFVGQFSGEWGGSRWLLVILWIAAVTNAISPSAGVGSVVSGLAVGAGMSPLAGLLDR